MIRYLPCVGLLAASTALGAVGSVAAQSTFTIRSLAAQGLEHGIAYDIDDSGRIAGEMFDGAGLRHPVVWLAATGQELATSATEGIARALGPNGEILGSTERGQGATRASIWAPLSPGNWGLTELENGLTNQPLSGLRGLASDGVAVGFVDDGIFTRPAVWSDVLGVPVRQLLPMPAFAVGGEATATIAGKAFGYVADFSESYPVCWSLTGGVPQLTMLPSLAGTGEVQAVRGNGDAYGSARANDGRVHLVRWVGAAITDLGALPQSDCFVGGVNESGDLVGWARGGGALPFRAIYKPRGGAIIDLNTKLPPGSRWTLLRAFGINGDGAIVGVGELDGFLEPFLMAPTGVRLAVPMPGTAGVQNKFALSQTEPMAEVFWFLSLAGGQTTSPACVAGLDLDAPLLFHVSTADLSGRSSFKLHVPAVLAGLPLLFQSFNATGCATSNVIDHTF